VWQVANTSTLDQAIPGRIQPVAHLASANIHDVCSPIPVQVDEQDTTRVELALRGKDWGVLHEDRIAKAAITELWPVLHASVPDEDLVEEAIAVHISKEEVERRVFGQWCCGRGRRHGPLDLNACPEALLAERGIPGEPFRIRHQESGTTIPVEIEPLGFGTSGLQVRQGSKRSEAVPRVGVAVVLVEASVPAVQNGEIRIAVTVEVGERTLTQGVGRFIDNQVLRSKTAIAFVGLEVPRTARVHQNAGDALAIQIDPAVVGTTEAVGNVL